MLARIILKDGGVNESNLVRTIQEQPVEIIGPEIAVLIARIYNRYRLEVFLRRKLGFLEQAEKEHDTNLNKVNFAFAGSTLVNLKMGLSSLFLTQKGLRQRGIEPLALYFVESDYSSFRKIREYQP